MMKRWAAVAMGAAVVLSVAGCLRMEADLDVNSDATVNGSFTVSIESETATLMGFMDGDALAEALTAGEVDGAEAAEGVGCDASTVDGSVAAVCSFENAAFDDPTGLWSVAEDGDNVVFRSSVEGDAESSAMFDGMDFGGPSGYLIKVTMPGNITDVTGNLVEQTSDTEFVIEAALGEAYDVTVTSENGESGGAAAIVGLIIILLIFGVIVAGIVLLIVWLVKRGKKQAPAEAAPAAEAGEAAAPDASAAPDATPSEGDGSSESSSS